MIRAGALALLAAQIQAHSNLIYPKPRNAIDSQDPRWAGGKSSPDLWQANLGPEMGQACACANGTEPCDIGQTCLCAPQARIIAPSQPRRSV